MTILNLKAKEAPKASRSAMETLLFSREEIDTWKLPPFQRALRVNAKVMQIAEIMRDEGGVIPGVLTLGRLVSDKNFYIVDGQHRVEGFKISELRECIADVRIVNFENMVDMAKEFVELNGRLVNMRPDDILRALEGSMPATLGEIRARCEFVSYGQIRRGTGNSSLIGMSALLRCWHMSRTEVPAQNAPSATVLAQALDAEETQKLIVFMQVVRSAWGDDPENYRLWSALNLTITMWLWRRVVIDKERGIKRSVIVTPENFRKGLLLVSSNASYADWLIGRNMCERDRSPCYNRLKAIFTKHLQKDSDKKILLPSPSWASR